MLYILIPVAAIAALLIYAATRPDSFRLERTINIAAPPEKVFPLVDNFRSWAQWSPWENIDLNLKRTYGGADAGRGANYAWDGNNKVGSGRMEITASTPSSKIVIQLDFLKPFEAHNTAEFTFVPNAGATTVTWAMYGPSNFISKLMQIFFSMEKMVGPQFEKGLADMKGAAEK